MIPILCIIKYSFLLKSAKSATKNAWLVVIFFHDPNSGKHKLVEPKSRQHQPQSLGLRSKISGQISSRVPHTSFQPFHGGLVREMGPPKISGKSRLVKYYNLARSFQMEGGEA